MAWLRWRSGGTAAARRRSSQEPSTVKGTTMTTTANPAKESLRKEQKEQRKTERERGPDAELDEALKDTFPASDPVAAQTPIKPGAKMKKPA
jgi:hypothetical protein